MKRLAGALLLVPTIACTQPWAGSTVGFNYNFYKPLGADRLIMNRVGAKLVRHDLPWSTVEKTPGVYDWTVSDEIVAEARQMGIQVIYVLAFGNSLYTGSFRNPPITPSARAAFVNYAKAAAARYKGEGIIWEIYNEPNAANFWGGAPSVREYHDLMTESVAGILSADSAAQIAAPALQGFDEEYLQGLLALGIPSGVKYLSLHPYSVDRTTPEASYRWLDRVRAMLYNSPQSSLPEIIVSEWSYLHPKMVDAPLQSSWQPRILLNAALHNVPIVNLYTLRGPMNPDPSEQTAGLVLVNGKYSDTYRKLLHLSPDLFNARLIGKVDLGDPRAYGVLYRNRVGEMVFCLWSEVGTRTVSIPLGDSSGVVSRTIGSAVPVTAANGVVRLTLTESPLLLKPSNGLPVRNAINLMQLPFLEGVGYDFTRSDYATRLFQALRVSGIANDGWLTLNCGKNSVTFSGAQLKAMNLAGWLKLLAENGVLVGNVDLVPTDMSLRFWTPGITPLVFNLGRNTWPAIESFQYRKVGQSYPEVVGIKDSRDADTVTVSETANGVRKILGSSTRVRGLEHYRVRVAEVLGGRLQVEQQVPGLGGIPFAGETSHTPDLFLWRFEGSTSSSVKRIRPSDFIWDSRFTLGMGAADFPFSAERPLRLDPRSVSLSQATLRLTKSIKLPSQTRRLEFWVRGRTLVSSATFRITSPTSPPSTVTVNLPPNRWINVRVPVAKVGAANYIKDFLDLRWHTGTDLGSMGFVVAEIRAFR